MDHSWCAPGKNFKIGSWLQESLLFQDGYLATVKQADGLVDTPFLED